jgi:type IX secretion system PorP/SprF family membrane protein
MIYKVLYIFLFLCLVQFTHQTVAQRHFITNQYVYDLYLMNPAEAGVDNCMNFNSFYQKQWFGTELAPTTQLLSVQSPLTSNVGSGTYFFNDRNGHNKKMSFQQAFSVKVTLRENSRGFTYLSFGMAALIEQAEVDQTGFTGGTSVIDPAISGGKESGVGFNLNSGFILRFNKFNTGFSVTNILANNNPMYNSEWEPSLPADMHFFCIYIL